MDGGREGGRRLAATIILDRGIGYTSMVACLPRSVVGELLEGKKIDVFTFWAQQLCFN